MEVFLFFFVDLFRRHGWLDTGVTDEFDAVLAAVMLFIRRIAASVKEVSWVMDLWLAPSVSATSASAMSASMLEASASVILVIVVSVEDGIAEVTLSQTKTHLFHVLCLHVRHK
jgi:hypothetical protein